MDRVINFNLFKKMKEIYLSKSKKTLLENFLSLSFLQVANYIFPLLTLPYLVRVLKPEKYGLIAFANAFVGYFMILTDYGFHLSAPREISINRDNKQKLSEIFSSVMIIKFFLVLFSLVLMTATIFLFDKFRRDWLLYYLTFGVVLGNVMFPTWFFQGIENMKFITLLNLIAKLIFTVSIFVFVRKQADYYFVPLLNSLGFIVAGILSIFIVIKNFGVKFIIPVREQILHQLKEGWHVFISTVAVSLYTTSNTFILGLFTDRKNVAYFAAGEKIVRSIQSLWSPVSQVLYPYFSKVFAVSLDKATQSFRKILNFTFLLTLLISILGCLSAPFFVKFLLGQDFENAIPVVRILIFIIFAVGVNNILGIQGLIALGLSKYFRNIVFVFGIFHLLYSSLLVKFYGIVGISIAVILTEIMIGIAEYIVLTKRRIL